MKSIWMVISLILLGSCSGGGGAADRAASSTTLPATTEAERTTTTTTAPAPECPESFNMPLDIEVSNECLSVFLRSAASQEGLDLTDDAEAQAAALCREIGMSGFLEATAAAFLAWDEGSRPSPSSNAPGFVAFAIAVYCPEYFDDLEALND